MSDYIRREDAVKETLKYIISSGVSNQSTWNECVRTIADTLQDMRSADVVPVETLQAKISELKYQMNCKTPNIDYYTGYMSALSTVEGIIAKMGMEE